MFSESLLDLSQSDKIESSWLIVLIKYGKDLEDIYTVASSATNIVCNSFRQLSKTLTSIKNNYRPWTEPWGTPHVTSSTPESPPLKLTKCFLLVR